MLTAVPAGVVAVSAIAMGGLLPGGGVTVTVTCADLGVVPSEIV